MQRCMDHGRTTPSGQRGPWRCVNPWAEIHVRSIFHEFGERIVAEQSDQSCSLGALRSSADGFAVQHRPSDDHTGALRRHEQYRNQLLEPVGDRSRASPVVTDIHNFYGSLRGAMSRARVLPVTSRQTGSCNSMIRLAMEKFAHDADTRGIPVGPESSAWIAEHGARTRSICSRRDGRCQRPHGGAMIKSMMDGTPELLEKQLRDCSRPASQDLGLDNSLETRRTAQLGSRPLRGGTAQLDPTVTRLAWRQHRRTKLD